MARLETIGRENWKDFVNLPVSVLILGKTDCPACKVWTEELSEFLEKDEEFSEIRFGKIELDRPGLIDFKRTNPWLSQLDDLPYNVIYKSGDKFKEFLGRGIERLTNRLRRAVS